MTSGQQSVGHPVNVASGAVYSTHRDYFVPGKLDLIWERRYSTILLGAHQEPLGPGWTTRYFATLAPGQGEFRLITPEGDLEIFADPQGQVDQGGIVRNLGTFQELCKLSGRYVVTRWNVETGQIERYIFSEGISGEAWPLENIEDLTGQALEMLRDKTGRLIGVRQKLEKRILAIEYTPENRIRQVSCLLPGGSHQLLVRYEYDKNGCLAAAYDPFKSADRYEYDVAGRMTREMVKDGGVFSFKYDDKGRCIETSGLDRYDLKRLRYHDAAQWTEVTDSLGNLNHYQWMASGQIVRQVDPFGAQRLTEYDDHGRVIAQISANGATIKYEYDADGNRSKVIDSMGHVFAFTFGKHHLPLTFTDGIGNTWKRTYDQANRLVSSQDPLGGKWTFVYDRDGNLLRITQPSSAMCQRRYSPTGVLLAASDWQNNWNHYSFDPFGRLREIIDSLGRVTKLGRDALGNVIEVTRPDGASIKWEYDSVGNIKRTMDENGKATSYRYGSCHRLLEVTDPLGRSMRYTWGSEPHSLESVINNKGEVYTFTYDAARRVVAEKGFDGRILRFSYNSAGQYIAFENALGERVVVQRDLMGRMIEQRLPSGDVNRFEYDANGRLIMAAGPESTVAFELDPLGKVLREVQNDCSVETRYDSVGNPVEQSTSLGYQVSYDYDLNGRLQAFGTNDGEHARFTRNAEGQETRRALPNGVAYFQDYDVRGRLTTQRLSSGMTESDVASRSPTLDIIKREYYYSATGMVSSIRDSYWGDASYLYDDKERLVEVIQRRGRREFFTYDEMDNITAVQDSSDGAEVLGYAGGDHLTHRGDSEFVYDGNGRIIEKTEKSEKGAVRKWTYSWDPLDRLRSVENPAGEVWKYSYDALGRRFLKEGPGQRVRFIWDRSFLIQQADDKHDPLSWIWDPVNSVCLAQGVGPSLYDVVNDQLGTPRELVARSGRLVWAVKYRPWGEVEKRRTAEVNCPLRFPGQWDDEESGLHYNYFRYYDPHNGRYISPDPIGLRGGTNLYSYAVNPLKWIDPFGLAGDPVDLSNPKSVPAFGHTFLTHGEGPKNTNNLTGRAAGTGEPQGQWNNNAEAAAFLAGERPNISGAAVVPIPPGLGKVIMPDGSIVDATHAVLVPKEDGGYKTAYPVRKPDPPPDPPPEEKKPEC